MDVPDYERNKEFLITWHYFLGDVENMMKQNNDINYSKQCCLLILRLFYMNPYDNDRDFYEQFEERMTKMLKALAVMAKNTD